MSTTDTQRAAINHLFTFVEEVTGLRQAVVKHLTQAPWVMDPSELDTTIPGLRLGDPAGSDPDLVCHIEKLDLPPCPAMPEPLLAYVAGFWRDPQWEETWLPFPSDELGSDEEQTHDETDVLTAERLAERERLEALRTEWLAARAQWLEERAPIVANNRLFDRLQTMRDLVQESNLRYECVFGNYRFLSDAAKTQNPNAAHYPLLIRPLTVDLISSRRNLPALEVRLNPDEPVRFLTEVLKPFAEEGLALDATVDTEAHIAEREGDVRLMGDAELEHRLQTMAVRLHPSARWRDTDAESEAPDSNVKFRVVPHPVLLVQLRPSGVREAIRCIREEIDETGIVPEHLKEIVCPDVYPQAAPDVDPTPTFEAKLAATAGEDEDILLTKPANSEQLAIAREIERNNVVLVQGPPGTGKTHTIANLLGHFLAQGKRVLVTSHTAKALTVLKDKLPREIQSLCVTMIGDRRDLERTTSSLTARLGMLNTTDLEARISVLDEDRRRITTALRDRRQRIFAQRLRERESLIVDGESLSLVEVARRLHEGEALADRIPGEVLEGPMPLTFDECLELYASNGRWSGEAVHDLSVVLPDPEALPSPDTMREMHARWETALRSADDTFTITHRRDAAGRGHIVFRREGEVALVCPDTAADVLKLAPDVRMLSMLDDPMIRFAFEKGMADASYVDAFTKLETELAAAADLAVAADREALMENVDVLIPEGCNPVACLEAALWFRDNNPDGRVSFFGRLFNSDARRAEKALEGVTVNSTAPSGKDAFERLITKLRALVADAELRVTWNLLAERAMAPTYSTFGMTAPKTLFDRYGTTLSEAARWWRQTFLPALETLRSNGVHAQGLDTLLDDWQRLPDPVEAARRFLQTIVSPVSAHVARIDAVRMLKTWKDDITASLHKAAPDALLTERLAEAVLVDPNAWAQHYRTLVELRSDVETYRRRLSLLEKLQAAAPDWALALREGRPGFDGTTPPADIDDAWRWKQLDRLYRHVTSVHVEELQADCTRLCADLRECTAQLAAARAWLAVKKRLQGSPALSHLSYLATYMKRAAGKGRKHAVWRREVNRLLPECQRAVPVWVMMIQDALLNFNRAAKFDIIIIDEASQADMTALPILYMGSKIIVVGDDKQVTPLAIGTNDAAVDALARQHLEGRVKEPKLYDSRLSIYGLVQSMAFPAHMLIEHFRCVPEIIGYSNRLSYHGAIRPLRDASSSKLKPAIVPWRVRGAYTDGRTNEEEAQTVIRLLRAMMDDPQYAGKTFGVIAMRTGRSTQINRIHQLLIENFDPREIESRELICGSPADFQGDERDVILLSLVDSAETGVILRKEGEGTEGSARKRWNVAVSRARDQLWIVHSFDANTQLKHDDLRRTLFDWAAELSQGEPDVEAVRQAADSEFEAEVAESLMRRGYRVEQQHPVGSYRLDMVIRSQGEAVALECDGERYHGEAQIRGDMERQTVLERNGWRFIRLRGAEYFRDPTSAIDRVCRDLERLGIRPEAANTPQSHDLLDRIRAHVRRQTGEDPVDEIVPEESRLSVDASSVSDDSAPVCETVTETPCTESSDTPAAEDTELTLHNCSGETEPDTTAPVKVEAHHQEAPIVPVPVKKSEITLTPELREPVKIAIPTLTDILDDEPVIEEDAPRGPGLKLVRETLAPNTPAEPPSTESTDVPAADALIEGVRAACLARGLTVVVETDNGKAEVLVNSRTLLRGACWSDHWELLLPSVEGVRARGVANYQSVHNGEWKCWRLTASDLADERFLKDFSSFAGRTAEVLCRPDVAGA